MLVYMVLVLAEQAGMEEHSMALLEQQEVQEVELMVV